MQLEDFLNKAQSLEPISFNDTIAVITNHYHYTPCTFSNGLSDQKVNNLAGTNEGSCKIFAFAHIHNLTPAQTLNLFGDYYHIDVLSDPQGTSHLNIRNFMRDGWAGICFEGQPLQAK